MFTDLNLTDMETCYKMVRTDLLQGLPLTAKRFGIEPELTARLAQAHARIYELPISYHGRSYGEGKKINWKDGVAALWYILKSNLVGPKAQPWTPSTPAAWERQATAGEGADSEGGAAGPPPEGLGPSPSGR
jgi:hypothetical protein